MSHEKSVTFKIGKKWYNASSVKKKVSPRAKAQTMTEDTVRQRVAEGKQKPIGVYDTKGEAIKAAKKRSQSFNKPKKKIK